MYAKRTKFRVAVNVLKKKAEKKKEEIDTRNRIPVAKHHARYKLHEMIASRVQRHRIAFYYSF